MEQEGPYISVILCTYNRSQLLRATLESLVAQSLEKLKYEIVAVDNASTDDTSAVVKKFQMQYPFHAINLVFEGTQGLGYARNTGCKNARGQYVAFIDDDCVATSDWLEVLLDCYESVGPSPWGIGGVVVPMYDDPKPDWFKDSYETDTWGDAPRFLTKGESFTGCNMSFRKDVIEKFGGFDVALGMKGEELALAEDTKLFRNIWSQEGDRRLFYYTPRAVVRHIIEPYKMTVSYQLKRAFTSGQVSYAIALEDSVFRRFVLFAGSIALVLWHCAKAVALIRTGHWKCWAVEQLYPLAYNIGRLCSYVGIRMVFRQRNVVTVSVY